MCVALGFFISRLRHRAGSCPRCVPGSVGLQALDHKKRERRSKGGFIPEKLLSTSNCLRLKATKGPKLYCTHHTFATPRNGYQKCRKDTLLLIFEHQRILTWVNAKRKRKESSKGIVPCCLMIKPWHKKKNTIWCMCHYWQLFCKPKKCWQWKRKCHWGAVAQG